MTIDLRNVEYPPLSLFGIIEGALSKLNQNTIELTVLVKTLERYPPACRKKLSKNLPIVELQRAAKPH